MSTTVRQPFGERSSAGTGKFPAALFTSTLGCAEREADLVERGRHLIGLADVARYARSPSRPQPRPPRRRARGAPPRAKGSRRSRRAARTRRAIALPRPVPPPVMATVCPVYAPAGSACEPSGGGSGRPIVCSNFEGARSVIAGAVRLQWRRDFLWSHQISVLENADRSSAAVMENAPSAASLPSSASARRSRQGRDRVQGGSAGAAGIAPALSRWKRPRTWAARFNSHN